MPKIIVFITTGIYTCEMAKEDWESYLYHDNKQTEQDQMIDRWCLRKGIRRRDLERHPRLDDVILLLRIRQEYATELRSNRRLLGTLDAYWGMVYKEQKTLQSKSYIKLEILVEQLEKIRQREQLKIKIIKAMRGTSQTQNKGHDMTAKGPNLPESKLAKKEQQGGREEVIDTPPWD